MIRSLVGARQAILAVAGTVLALSLSTAGPAAGASAAAVPSGEVTVKVVAVNGSGCGPDSHTTVATKADKTGFRIRYSDFVAESGGGVAVKESRKNCQAGVQITVPSGWTFGIAEAEYRGKARLYSGATAVHRTNYYWQGSSENTVSEERFAGPFSGGWESDDFAPVVIYSSCTDKRILNINTSLRLEGASTSSHTSTISMAASEGDVDTLFNFSWRQC